MQLRRISKTESHERKKIIFFLVRELQDDRMDDVRRVSQFLKSCTGNIRFADIKENHDTVFALLTRGRRGVLKMSYMDDRARDVCCELASSLRELLERNIFFDLVDGRLVVYLTETVGN